MVLWNPGEAECTLVGWRAVFYSVVDDFNFKKGSFKSRVGLKTQPLEAVNIFLDSGLCTPEEEQLLKRFRRSILSLMRGGPRLASDEKLEEEMLDMVAKDAALSGASFTMESFINGVVKKDAVVNAAVAEKRAATASRAAKGDTKKETSNVCKSFEKNKQVRIEHRFPLGRRNTDKDTNDQPTPKPKSSSTETTPAEFGVDFKKNLRGAFF